ncbi:MAG: NAD(P)H-hydrate dehydratase [Planctomycetota bacterium]
MPDDRSAEQLSQVPPRKADSHKGDYGRVLVIGGSRGMAGAPALAGMSALRSGSGLVAVATPAVVQPIVASFEPSYTTHALGDDRATYLTADHYNELLKIAEGCDVVAIGPGLGAKHATARLVHRLYRRLAKPIVVDADALNAISELPECIAAPGGPRVLTPHPGEFARLHGPPGKTDEERSETAAELAARDGSRQTVVVLKGNRTVITDGHDYWINQTGNPGMATGGSGDCLTGVIASLIGQGLSPLEAARLGAHAHGLAGDLAADELSQAVLTASDLPRFLGQAFRGLSG